MSELHPGHTRALTDPQVFAEYTGVAMRAISFKKVDMGWQVILKGLRHDGSPVYSLYAAVSLSDAIAGAIDVVSGRDGARYWHHDKYA